jgi:hypothetical protein
MATRYRLNYTLHNVFSVYVCCSMAGALSTRFEQLGVNFKAPKAARLLHARRLCDLRTIRFGRAVCIQVHAMCSAHLADDQISMRARD